MQVGRSLVALGLVVVALGLVVWFVEWRGWGRGGLLPGDITVRRGPVVIFFPVVTCILLSLALTLFRRWIER